MVALGRPAAVPAPVEPNPAPAAAVEPVEAPEPAVEQQRPRAVKATPRPSTPVNRKKEKVGYTVLESEANRTRAAFMHTRMDTGIRSLSDFIAAAVAKEVKRLEVKHNGGQSWIPMSAGEIPTGRPLDV